MLPDFSPTVFSQGEFSCLFWFKISFLWNALYVLPTLPYGAMMAPPPGTLPSCFYVGPLLLSQPLHSVRLQFPQTAMFPVGL